MAHVKNEEKSYELAEQKTLRTRFDSSQWYKIVLNKLYRKD